MITQGTRSGATVDQERSVLRQADAGLTKEGETLLRAARDEAFVRLRDHLEGNGERVADAVAVFVLVQVTRERFDWHLIMGAECVTLQRRLRMRLADDARARWPQGLPSAPVERLSAVDRDRAAQLLLQLRTEASARALQAHAQNAGPTPTVDPSKFEDAWREVEERMTAEERALVRSLEAELEEEIALDDSCSTHPFAQVRRVAVDIALTEIMNAAYAAGGHDEAFSTALTLTEAMEATGSAQDARRVLADRLARAKRDAAAVG